MTFLSYDRPEEYGVRPKPTTAQSMLQSVTRPAIRSLYAVETGLDWATGTPTDQRLTNAVNLIDYQLNHPDFGTGQKVANGVANAAGMFLDPISMALGGILGKVTGKLALGVMDLVPEYVSVLGRGGISREAMGELLEQPIGSFSNNKFARFLPKNFHDMVEKSSKIIGDIEGFTATESFLENYDVNQQRLDYGGLVKSIALNGGIGLSIPVVGWTAGIIFGRAERNLARTGEASAKPIAELPKDERVKAIKDAFKKGAVTQEEHDYIVNLYEKKNPDQSHIKSAIPLLKGEEHPVNALTGSVDFPFMTEQELKQLQTFAVDQMAASPKDFERTLSTFISHKMLDRYTEMLTDNPYFLDGIRGHLSDLNERLAAQEKQLAEHDIYVEKTTTRANERLQPITQQKLYKMMREGELHHREMPFIVPKNVQRIRQAERKIDIREQSLKEYQKELKKLEPASKKYNYFDRLIEKTQRRIDRERSVLEEYKAGEGKVLTQAEEVRAIEKRLLGKKELPKNYETSNDFLRLLDLSHVYPQARALMRRIARREEYEMQKAYHQILGDIVRIAESGFVNIADPKRVSDYLKARIEGKLDIAERAANMQEIISEAKKLSSKVEIVSDETSEDSFNRINNNPNISSDAKAEFNLAYSKLKQFKGSQQALTEMVNCFKESGNVII